VSLLVNGIFCDTDREALAQLQRMTRALTPDWQRPERFHQQKGELIGALSAWECIAYARPSQLNARPRTNGQRHVYTPDKPKPLAMAAQVFRAPVAASEPQQEAGTRRPRLRRVRHRYPLPPRQLAALRSLL
jgi:hypothetical protein